MNRLDLIIDALQKAKDGWQCFDEYEKALAAARELKALKPVGITDKPWVHGCALFDGVDLPNDTLLYALDEVNDV
jgi:hypothetical protein